MSLDLSKRTGVCSSSTEAVWGELPASMRVLLIHTQRALANDLVSALACDRASRVHLYEALGLANGLSRMRHDAFDVILIRHDPPELDALELLDTVRAGGPVDQPILVLGTEDEARMVPMCYEAGADAYVAAQHTSVRTFLWTVARAIERGKLIRDHRRLLQFQRQRVERDRQETSEYLSQLAAMCPPAESPDAIPWPHRARYRELMRAHIMMGMGRMGDELQELADALGATGVPPQHFLPLHAGVLEELVGDLAGRSARHVMYRASLLALDFALQLAEQYRRNPGLRPVNLSGPDTHLGKMG